MGGKDQREHSDQTQMMLFQQKAGDWFTDINNKRFKQKKSLQRCPQIRRISRFQIGWTTCFSILDKCFGKYSLIQNIAKPYELLAASVNLCQYHIKRWGCSASCCPVQSPPPLLQSKGRRTQASHWLTLLLGGCGTAAGQG